MAESVKKTRKKAISPINGQELGPGPGRPKGSKNKLTILEEAFFEAWEELEGKKGLKDHIKKHRREFYKTVISVIEDKLKKQTPTDVSVDHFIFDFSKNGNGDNGKD